MKQQFKESSFKKDEKGDIILSSIASEKFKEFAPSDIFLLYEYAAHVETKLKIYADEREMLILAGRYTVYLENKKIKELLSVQK